MHVYIEPHTHLDTTQEHAFANAHTYVFVRVPFVVVHMNTVSYTSVSTHCSWERYALVPNIGKNTEKDINRSFLSEMK